jgi:dipeptidyl aminopeptidase/acylaminoacyl peptidase
VIFRHSAPDAYDGALAAAPLDHLAAVRLAPSLRCERVHFAGGRGVCLTANRGVVTTYRAVLFDAAARPWGELALAGVPSRVQVSADGRLAGTTVFVSGHSYAAGDFSTRTSLIDLETGAWLVEDLETFTVRRDGRVISAPDFNFWGVTFAGDGRTFYATLGTGGQTLLVRGDVPTRAAAVLHDGVECPSLSPDGRRIAFKHRTPDGAGRVTWRLWVLDLDSGRRHPLAETRDVDDQPQWLDDDTVAYALPGSPEAGALMDQWSVSADGTAAPRLFLPRASSAGVAGR